MSHHGDVVFFEPLTTITPETRVLTSYMAARIEPAPSDQARPEEREFLQWGDGELRCRSCQDRAQLTRLDA